MEVTDVFIAARTTVVSLADGTRVRIRPVVAADKPRLAEGLARLSPESRFLRFLRPVERLSKEELAYLTEVDYRDHFAWGAELATDRLGIGLARYVRLEEEPETAEAAVAVLDDYQGRGLGSILLDVLAESALENGITRFRSYVLGANEKVLSALRRPEVRMHDEQDATVCVEIPLPLPPNAVRDSALYATLRAAARGEMRVRPVG